MTEEEALEATICADPNDGHAWTVYGDWLLSQGDPRGEAISIWNRLRDTVLPQEERRVLSERYEKLCAPRTWLTGLPEEQVDRMLAEPSEDFRDWEDSEGWSALEGQPVLFELEWRHGFVLGADLHAVPSWRSVLETFRALPVSRLFCRASVIGFSEDELEPLLATGLLRRVRSLQVEGVSAPVLLKLLSSPLLGELESLDFTISLNGDDTEELVPIDPAGAAALAALPSLAKLRVLRVGHETLTSESFQALASTSLLSRLESLDLSMNELGPEGAYALAASGSRLRTLILQGCGVRDEGIAALADSVALRGLRRLDLTHNQLTEEGAKALATSLLVELTHLDIGENDPGNAGLRTLLRSPALSGLRILRAKRSGLSRRYDTSGFEPHTEVFLALPHLTEFACNERLFGTERETHTIGERQVDYYTSSSE